MPLDNIPNDQQSTTYWTLIIGTVIAFFAQLFRVMSGETRPANWIQIVASAGVGALAGYISGAMLLEYVHASPQATMAVQGVAGYFGGSAMTAFGALIDKKYGTNLTATKPPSGGDQGA